MPAKRKPPKRYYFVAYAWRHRGDANYRYSEVLLHEHPVAWLAKLRIDKETQDEHRVLFWEVVPAGYYHRYKDVLG